MPLLSTKLHIPSSRAYLVPRPRLIDLLEVSKHAKLTLVSAPAGYGKSTLVSEWLHQTGLAVAWLSLDANDNDLRRLVTYIIAAIRTAIADFGELTLGTLETPQPLAPHMILTTLVNELDNSGEQVALILDDYHLITERSVHEAIAFLLEHLPAFFHIFILTAIALNT